MKEIQEARTKRQEKRVAVYFNANYFFLALESWFLALIFTAKIN
jgi:hypothetical protein